VNDGNLSEARFALVAARWNDSLVVPLIEGARGALLSLGVAEPNIDVIRVPGSFEIPQGALYAARSGRYDAVVGLGVLIRGATLHFDVIAREAATGLGSVTRMTGVPAAFGIVTAENTKQALARCGGALGNRGADAALAAADMVRLRGTMLPFSPNADSGDDENGVEPRQHEPRGGSRK
jgi:6,7-dimethyl-8-ribityllumazine synthase